MTKYNAHHTKILLSFVYNRKLISGVIKSILTINGLLAVITKSGSLVMINDKYRDVSFSDITDEKIVDTLNVDNGNKGRFFSNNNVVDRAVGFCDVFKIKSGDMYGNDIIIVNNDVANEIVPKVKWSSRK